MSENLKFEEQKERATKILMTMFDYLGLEASLRIEDKGQKIAIKIVSEDAGRIIGRKGQTLESLQLLLNRIMFRNEEECPRLTLDIDGYARGNVRGRREGGEGGGDEDDARPPRRERNRESGSGAPGGGRRGRNGGEPRGESMTEEQLTIQAQDAAKEVKRWGEPVTLPKMNAHDRRIIHVTLQDDPEIETRSEGDGNFKNVIISLKKEG